MWNRKNSFERGIDSLQDGTATAVEDLAATVRERFDNDAGRQLAGNLTQLARSVEELDLSDKVAKRRRELEKATKKANRQVNRAVKDLEKSRARFASDANALATRVGERVEEGGQQLATLGQKTVPGEPTGWIMPTLLGFLLGFGAGFLLARVWRKGRKDELASH